METGVPGAWRQYGAQRPAPQGHDPGRGRGSACIREACPAWAASACWPTRSSSPPRRRTRPTTTRDARAWCCSIPGTPPSRGVLVGRFGVAGRARHPRHPTTHLRHQRGGHAPPGAGGRRRPRPPRRWRRGPVPPAGLRRHTPVQAGEALLPHPGDPRRLLPGDAAAGAVRDRPGGQRPGKPSRAPTWSSPPPTPTCRCSTAHG